MASKVLPIYNGQSHSLPKLSEGNAGLHFYRLYTLNKDKNDFYQNEEEKDRKENPKTSFLKQYAKENSIGDKELIKRYIDQQIALAKAAHGTIKIYTLKSHFVTGMGNAHPVENGFQWHYTLGVPYLAGSQVKGMVRSMIERYFAGSQQDQQKLLLQWFGSTTKNPLSPDYDAATGELIFFDALPLQPPVMTVDVMTPHMGNWYSDGEKINNLQDDHDKIPADWHDPVPIPFLAVKNAQFVFSIGKRKNSNIDLEEVWDVLDQALNYLSAGGKTNTGFGYMQKDEKETAELYEEAEKRQQEEKEKAQFAQALAGASEFHAELLRTAQEQGWEKDGDAGKTPFTTAISGELLEKLQQNPEERDSIAYVVALAEKHYPAQMKNPSGKKTKPKQRIWIEALLKLHNHE